MALNTFQHDTRVVTHTALGLLRAELILGNLVYREAEQEFNGSVGTTVNFRRPARLTATDAGIDVQTRNIVAGTMTETVLPIAITAMPTNAIRLSDEDMRFEINSFVGQVLAPQVSSIADYIEGAISTALVSATAGNALALNPDGTDALSQLEVARVGLSYERVPTGNRWLVCGVDAFSLYNSLEELTDVDRSGSPDALREATIGRLKGFTVVECSTLPRDTAIAMHRTALAVVTAAPTVPSGAAYGQSISDPEGGYAIRWIIDYDPAVGADRSYVSTYFGSRSITDTPRDGGGASQVRARALVISGS